MACGYAANLSDAQDAVNSYSVPKKIRFEDLSDPKKQPRVIKFEFPPNNDRFRFSFHRILEKDTTVAFAYLYQQKLKAKAAKGRKKPSKSRDSQRVEFLYAHAETWRFSGNKDRKYVTFKFKITKRTPKCIYIDKKPWTADRAIHTDWRAYDIKQAVFDRERLEQAGWDYIDSRRLKIPWYVFVSRITTSPIHPKDMSYNGKSVYQILGVEKSCTLKDVRRAFRTKSKGLHPDKGGNADDFIALKEAYRIVSRSLKEQEERG
jgi:hypothetical protein